MGDVLSHAAIRGLREVTMADEQTNGADVGLKIAGQEFNVKNVKSLNTGITIAVFVIVCVSAAFLYVHTTDAKDGGKELAAELKASNKEIAVVLKDANRELSEVLKEMARASRETNCLLAMSPDKRGPENSELCKRLSR